MKNLLLQSLGKTLLVLLPLSLLPDLAAEERSPITLTFLPPELEGRFSLGIYNADGKLVRVLHSDAPQSAFRAGLNGLITQWDGTDDSGASLPPGNYVARGYVVGEELEVEGEAFHFNNWTERDGIPAIESVVDFRACADGDILIIADTLLQGRILGRVDEDKGFLWLQYLTPESTIVTCNSHEVFIAEKDGLPHAGSLTAMWLTDWHQPRKSLQRRMIMSSFLQEQKFAP